MQSELASRLNAYSLTNSDDLTKIKRWLNMAQQYICGKKLWPFMMAEDIVQTVTDITTGTVSISAGDTALTFSSAPTVSVQDRYIQLQTSNDWYKITAHTASSTSATISPAFVGTSNLTAGTYTVRKLLYSTNVPLLQILDMKQLVSPIRIVSQSPREADFFLPLYYGTSSPYIYIISSPSSAGLIQFSLLPAPDAVLNLMVRGTKALTDMSADSDTSVIPIQWHDAIINIAAFYGFQGLDDTRANTELNLGEARIKDMANVYTSDLGRHRVMQSVDQGDFLSWSLPANFGSEV